MVPHVEEANAPTTISVLTVPVSDVCQATEEVGTVVRPVCSMCIAASGCFHAIRTLALGVQIELVGAAFNGVELRFTPTDVRMSSVIRYVPEVLPQPIRFQPLRRLIN